MLLHYVKANFLLEVGFQHGIGQFGPEGRLEFEGRIMLAEPAHQVQRMQQAVVGLPGQQHNLEAETALSGVSARRRRKGTGPKQRTLCLGQFLRPERLHKRRTYVFIGPCRANPGREGGVVPQAAAAVQVGAEQPRDIACGRNGPGHQLPVGVRCHGRYHVDGELGANFAGVQVHQLSQRKAVPMRHFGNIHLPGDRRDGTFHYAAGRIDVVHYI